MSISEQIERRAPRLAVVAIGLAAFTMAIPATAEAGPDFPIVVKAKSAKTYTPQRRVSSRKYKRSARRATEVSAARCSAPNSGCTSALPRALQAYASVGPAHHAGRITGSTNRNCLTSAARALLSRLEARFGAVRIVSTCRRGATIAGTRRPSMHRYGKAIDFVAPSGQKAAMVRWLRDNSPGVTMTYHGMDHIHTDVGPYHKLILGARGRRHARKHHTRHRVARTRQAPQQISAQRWLAQR
jgi:hypothetical protein